MASHPHLRRRRRRERIKWDCVSLPATFLATPPKLCIRLPRLVPSLCEHMTSMWTGIHMEMTDLLTQGLTSIWGLRTFAVKSRMDPPTTTTCRKVKLHGMFQYPCLVERFLLSYTHITNCWISLASSPGLHHSFGYLQSELQVTQAEMEVWEQG